MYFTKNVHEALVDILGNRITEKLGLIIMIYNNNKKGFKSAPKSTAES